MQLVGQGSRGIVYEVVASGLRVPLGKPVYLAASVSTTPSAQNEIGGSVDFYLRDFSRPESKLQVKTVAHGIVQGLQDPDLRLVVGGRSPLGSSLW